MLLISIYIAVLTAAAAGFFSLIFKRWVGISKFIGFSSLGLSGICAAYAGVYAIISQNPVIYHINSGLPGIVWQFKLDSLSGFFFTIVGMVVVCVALYGPNYMRSYERQHSILGMTFFTGLFIAGMYLVLLAADLFSFLLAWELMSISSYFLVAYHHEHAVNREAAFVYLLMAHLSGLLILFAFGVLIKFSNGTGFGFDIMQVAQLPTMWAHIAFLLAFIGFGMKAGIVPLHVWLPRAHPVAPSHISALMSGVMLKVAIYGFLRFSFSLLRTIHWQWGVLVLVVGTASALLGVLYALMQHDLKKLLAYHSVENIGIILIGIGLAFVFLSTGYPLLGALGLIAALYHCLNHALFKSLLFLGAGSILQYGKEQDLEKMGGLIHKMPYTAAFFLIGCISISALPPFNGFVSEWLTFQTALQAAVVKSGVLRTIIPVAAALLALTGALAAACFVKVYGIAFLGQGRTRHIRHAREVSLAMRCAMGILAFLCLVFGILPTFTIHFINVIPQQLLGVGLAKTANWLWLVPLSSSVASYSAIITCGSILGVMLLGYVLLHLRGKKSTKVVLAKPWDCGFGALSSRMQYSATAFAMPIRRVFKELWPITEKIERAAGANLKYSLHIGDWVWKYLYDPFERWIFLFARSFAKIQGGNVRVYLAYAFFTLIILLWVVS